MAQAERALERLGPDGVLEASELAGAPPELDVAVSDDGDSCGIIPAVLEAPKAVQNDGDDRFWADVADDAAHRRPASSVASSE
jgi:hypothetical protein